MSLKSIAPALLLAALAAGCASSRLPAGMERILPGETVEFDDQAFQLRQVQEDFILLRYRAPGPNAGVISGFVDEVFRVSRYELGEGRWYADRKLPGVYFQWLGFDSFALAHDPKALRGAEVVMLR